MTEPIDYAVPGPLTSLDEVEPVAFAGLPDDAVGICRPVPNLVLQPADATAAGLSEERFAENQVRRADQLVATLLALEPAPLVNGRARERRVVGTCRHFAVLACALLRHRGIPARVRCGFATYFQPGQGLDHWITEYWHVPDGRWVRIDPEALGLKVLERPEDLAVGEFLTGGEAWAGYRDGRLDAAVFGVHGTENWGPAEIRGNAIRDLAALNKVEMLPWDEWGRMAASYRGETGSGYDALIDVVAEVTAGEDLSAVAALYAEADLAVPPELVR